MALDRRSQRPPIPASPPAEISTAAEMTIQQMIDTLGAQRRTIGHLVTAHQNMLDLCASLERRVNQLTTRLDTVESSIKES